MNEIQCKENVVYNGRRGTLYRFYEEVGDKYIFGKTNAVFVGIGFCAGENRTDDECIESFFNREILEH